MHLVGYRAVAGMALAPGAQLDQLHRLAGVQVEDEADPVTQAERVGSSCLKTLAAQPLVLGGREVKCASIVLTAARKLDLLRNSGAEIRRERLPLDGQHAVAL